MAKTILEWQRRGQLILKVVTRTYLQKRTQTAPKITQNLVDDDMIHVHVTYDTIFHLRDMVRLFMVHAEGKGWTNTALVRKFLVFGVLDSYGINQFLGLLSGLHRSTL